MLKVDEAVPRIQELLKTEEGGSAVVVWSDGRITTLDPQVAETPEERLPDGDFVVAKFIVREWDLADEEIRDRLNVGLAAGGEWHH